MAKDEKKEGFSTTMMLAAILVTALSCYWQLAPDLARAGINLTGFNKVIVIFKSVMTNTYALRAYVILFVLASSMMKTMKKEDIPISKAVTWTAIGTTVFLLPTQDIGPLYFFTCFIGLSICFYGYPMIFRRIRGGVAPEKDSFLQNDKEIQTKYSVNIPYHYYYQKRRHDGNISVVAPFRASIVLGVPGAWKSYAIYVHALKSTSKTIGASQLSERALRLETAANALDGVTIRAEHARLLAEYEAVLQAVRSVLPETGDGPADDGEALEFMPEVDVLELTPEG